MSKGRSLLLGVVFLIIGIMFLLQSIINLNYFVLAGLAIGISLIVLYRMKRKGWALSAGLYLSTYSGYLAFNEIFNLALSIIHLTIIFFITQGIIFIVLYLSKKKNILLHSGSILFWIGVFLLINLYTKHAFLLLLMICLGLGLLTIFILSSEKVSIGIAFFGLFFIAVGILAFVTDQIVFSPLRIASMVGALCLILVAIRVLFVKKE